MAETAKLLLFVLLLADRRVVVAMHQRAIEGKLNEDRVFEGKERLDTRKRFIKDANYRISEQD